MKKLLLGVITLLLIILVGIALFKGIKIGSLKVYGVTEIKQADEKLDEDIKSATKLASTDYQKKISDLEEEVRKLEAEKNSYQDMVAVSTDSEVEAANQTYNYTLDMLYIRIENHAKAEGINLKMDVTKSSSGATNVYNLNFTATGVYAQIEEFITDIEDDSKLGFKIEEFKMTSSSQDGSTVKATFVCKNISITGISSSSAQ